MLDVKKYIAPYVALDKPIPYKGFLIHPFSIDEYYDFYACESVLRYEKNRVPNITVDIIQMSYLSFVVFKLFTSEEIIDGNKASDIWKYRFFNILSKSLKIPMDKFEIKLVDKKVVLFIDNVQIHSGEFDEIRKIILFQNLYGYDDTEMSNDFRRVVEEFYELKNKGYKNIDLDEKIDVIMSQSARGMKDIKEISLIRFEKIFHRIIDEKEYTINKIAEGNGCKFKTPIEHWVYKKDKNKYANIFGSMENFAQQNNS